MEEREPIEVVKDRAYPQIHHLTGDDGIRRSCIL